MPVKFGRLGLGESPWERVRERGFEWEREGRGKRQKGGGARRLGAKKAEREKAGRRSPSQQIEMLAKGGAPPHIFFYIGLF